jgi:hypothetical protein
VFITELAWGFYGLLRDDYTHQAFIAGPSFINSFANAAPMRAYILGVNYLRLLAQQGGNDRLGPERNWL